MATEVTAHHDHHQTPPATPLQPPRREQQPPQEVVEENRASLYVGDLERTVTESDLKSAFEKVVGPISSLRLCRCRFTGNSLRYAYINFFSQDQASKALNLLNHTNLSGKPMRIMWPQRNPLARKNGVANLFVKNLDSSVDSAQLESLFGKFGTVLSCKVAEENGKSKGYGFIQFDSEDSAAAAQTSLHDSILSGRNLYVSKFLKKSERTVPRDESCFTNLYVCNLDEDVTEDTLKDMFSIFGNILNAVVMKDSEGKSRCFGFVNFESAEDAMKAMNALNGTLQGSKTLCVRRAQKKAEKRDMLKNESKGMVNSHDEKLQASNLYVKNLNFEISDDTFQKIFSSYGRIVSAIVMRHDSGKSKGYGFVCFSSPEEARNAMVALNGAMFQGRYLYVAIARRKENSSKPLKFLSESLPLSSYSPSYSLGIPLCYGFPASSLQHNCLQHQIPYPQFGTNLAVRYPFISQNFQNSFSTHVPAAGKVGTGSAGNVKDWTYQQNPMGNAISNARPRDSTYGYGAGQNFISRNKENKRGPADYFSSRNKESKRGAAAAVGNALRVSNAPAISTLMGSQALGYMNVTAA